MTIEDVKKLLKPGTNGYLATSENNQPDLRGWQFQYSEGNRFYFMTSNQKNVYNVMRKNPNVAFACEVGGTCLRLLGKATFLTDKAEITKAFAGITKEVQAMYKNADNPTVAIFYVEHGTAKLAKGLGPFESIAF